MITVLEEKCQSFNFIPQKGNWTHLAEKNSQPGGKFTTIFNIFKSYHHKNILKTSVLLWASKSCYVI